MDTLLLVMAFSNIIFIILVIRRIFKTTNPYARIAWFILFIVLCISLFGYISNQIELMKIESESINMVHQTIQVIDRNIYCLNKISNQAQHYVEYTKTIIL